MHCIHVKNDWRKSLFGDQKLDIIRFGSFESPSSSKLNPAHREDSRKENMYDQILGGRQWKY